ncbi:uncharacterized protein LOC135226409 isoform X2 [Macrobrachium nipponense]|uniref:uncharacterized protein LOC135226409 isoform X2 n=1 Tax=Macrobrachium nipponense TaxID=159736 RepID=UPI0030C83C37
MSKSRKHSCTAVVLTRDEARDVMEMSQQKDFWTVEMIEDNSIQLQGALDVLYNSEGGSDYQVEYTDSLSTRRLVINCTICNVLLSSYDTFSSHENGKSHKKVRQHILGSKQANEKGELKLKPMNALRGVYPPGSLEDKIDRGKHPVLGIQFVYKEIIKEETYFTCQLCTNKKYAVSGVKDEMYNHLISKNHSRRYLDVKFGLNNIGSSSFASEVAKIEELEGRIHAPIMDFTSLLPKKPDTIPTSHGGHPRVTKTDASSNTDPFVCNIKDLTDEIHSLCNADCLDEILEDDDYLGLFAGAFSIYNDKLYQFFSKQSCVNSGALASINKVKQLFSELYMEDKLRSSGEVCVIIFSFLCNVYGICFYFV